MGIGGPLALAIMNRKDNNNSEKTLEFDKRLATAKACLTFLPASILAVFQPIVHAIIRSNFSKVSLLCLNTSLTPQHF